MDHFRYQMQKRKELTKTNYRGELLKNTTKILPCTSFEARGVKGPLSSFSISGDDFLDLLFMTKNAIIPPTTKIDITIPAIPPAPIPELLPPSPPSDDVLPLPDL